MRSLRTIQKHQNSMQPAADVAGHLLGGGGGTYGEQALTLPETGEKCGTAYIFS